MDVCNQVLARFRRIGAALRLCSLLLILPGLCNAEVLDKIIASVDGEPITMHDLRDFSAANGMQLPEGSDPRSLEAQREALKGVITQKLMEEEMKTYADRIDESAVDHYIAKIEEKNHWSDEDLRDQLAHRGLSYQDYRKRARIELEKMEMFERQVREKVSVAPEQIQAYYKAHAAEFTIPKERFRLAQILIAVDPKSPPAKVDAARIKAEELRKRALTGEDFGELARKYSDDDSKTRGGELGNFAPEDILDQIHSAVVKLNTGQISEVVESRHGFHIVKVEEHLRPGLKPLNEVKDDIRDKLSGEAAENQFKRWINEELVKNHHVESFL